ncbi:MAG: NUDIX domain-containing protein [Bacteroidetes bacterium]|nr:NUDIX domain-containing protein [Bacteroidota bacterium]
MAFNDNRLSGRVGAVMLIRKDGAVLMQLRDHKEGLRHSGKWVPPGGHAEQNEDMKTCTRRELLEETNYDCPDLKLLTEFEDHVEGWNPYMLTVYWAFYDEIQNYKCMEGQDLKFINRDQAKFYDIPGYLIDVWDLALKVSKLTFEKS